MGDIVMPRLSDTMEEGTILRWLKSDGELLSRGTELVEIETDKAAMTYESDQEGALEIVAPEGATLAVGELIARVGSPSPKIGDGPASDGPAAASAEQPTTAAAGASGNGQAELTAPAPPPPAPAAAPQRSSHERGRVRASPLARRLARESGIDLGALSGSGPGGRIVKADIVGAQARAPAPGVSPAPASEPAPAPAASAPAPAPASARAPAAGTAAPTPTGEATSADEQGPPSQAAILAGVATAKGETTDVELTRTQTTVARRMAESKATIPDFTLTVDVDMEACVALREELKRMAPAGGGAEDASGSTPTYNDMVVKAAAVALREHPRANGSYRDGRVQLHSRVNVGVAVAAMDALIVPTVFDADEKSLGEVARATRALIERVRDGTISPPELSGGTFTVSNLGMYGIRTFTAIINPPQAAILSVGSLERRAVANDGEVQLRHTMSLTLACDHRILYGADAALFLARIRELLQTPSALSL
jgi:pyruvate dehydrogenase E2 component (dihydrolipoamide acetyltransferase)